MLFDVVMLCSGILLSEACRFIEDIREKNIDFEIIGSGLHLHLLISAHIASINRFSECRILYELDIPKGAYIDSDSINSTLLEHSFFSDAQFNVEAPAGKSEDHKVYLLLSTSIRKKFVLEDRLKLPVHLRYHACRNTDGITEVATVVFNTPVIALDCPHDYQSLQLESCPGKREYKIAGLESKSPYWITVEPLEKRTATAIIPIGNCLLLPYIFCGTILTLLMGLYCICSAQKGSKLIHKAE
uniref:Phosphatidylinositol-glycan biosynthesis class X protein n=1 Tax=Heterorhabditis bacteriophora TaxID=37862 RepID=A0A1I7WJ27_HETBA